MSHIDLIAVVIVCATALAWHAISRHYAKRDERERDAFERRIEAHRAECASSAFNAREWCEKLLTKGSEHVDQATAIRDEVTSALAQRDWAKVNMRLENLEARMKR